LKRGHNHNPRIAALQASADVRMLGPHDLNGLHDPIALIGRAAGLNDPVVPDVLPGRDAGMGPISLRQVLSAPPATPAKTWATMSRASSMVSMRSATSMTL
jgi:hypothetical protein